MKKTKIALTLVCAILLVAASVMGTLAYLTATTGPVTNTFTVGNVSFSDQGLDEADVDQYGNLLYKDVDKTQLNDRVTENTYKLVPGHKYTKDPTVHIAANSEACWLFVKVVNPIASIEAATTIKNQMTNATTGKWAAVDEANGIYAYKTKIESSTSVQDIVVFSEFTLKTDAVVDSYNGQQITVKAGLVQADGFTTYNAAWTAVKDTLFPAPVELAE